MRKATAVLAFGLIILLCEVRAARAQHGDYLLGTAGLLAAQQPPEGIAYQNLWSFYHTSGDEFRQTGPIKCGRFGRLCLGANFSASGRLDLFVDQNIFWLVTPFKIPLLGATYGALIDIPFALADTSDAGSLEPVLTFSGFRSSRTFSGPVASSSSGVTKGSIGNIFFQPIDLGWHFKRFDAIATGGFLAPTGPYNPNARVNIGYGHWTGLLGLGGILYADAERTWSLSIFTHYEMYASQMGRPYTLGDEVPFEWGLGKSLDLHNNIFERLTLGAVGYAQWQTTDNQIDIVPSSTVQSTLIHRLEESQMQIYAAGPEVQLLTKYGLFSLRYYDEFGANATPSGQQLMFSIALAGKPWG